MREAETERLERVVGYVLRAGSIGSTLILTVGMAVSLFAPAWGSANQVIRAGLLVLLLTPVARVVASVIEYLRDRDWLFGGLTLIVLVIVVASIVVGAM